LVDSETAQFDVGSSCFYTLPAVNSDRPVDLFRILRVAFVSASATKHSSLARPLSQSATLGLFTVDLPTLPTLLTQPPSQSAPLGLFLVNLLILQTLLTRSPPSSVVFVFFLFNLLTLQTLDLTQPLFQSATLSLFLVNLLYKHSSLAYYLNLIY